MKRHVFLSMILLLTLTLLIPAPVQSQQTYILLGWNDLGMHCANKDFSKIAVLPPYNNVHAQLIIKQPNQLPQIVNNGYIISYSIPGNTYSVGKTNFWTYAQVLFNLPQPLPPNIGLTGHGLTGTLDTSDLNGFVITGIPVTPYPDNDLVNEHPFGLFHLVARATGDTTTLAYTDNVIPISNEISCVSSGCHSSEQSILNEHENVPGFNQNGPVLCAHCHASNALGTLGDSLAKPLSFRIHDTHSFIQPVNDINTCYKCHPGPNTRCLRDTMSWSLVCQNCHGTMSNVANSIENGRRPWLDEPKCGSTTCHGSNFAEEPGKLFRMSKGHGGLFCSACHGSPHAIVPTKVDNDNVQNIRLQGHRGVLKDCLVCHSSPPIGPGPHGIYFIGIRKISSEVPAEFALHQNYPNPFNPITVIRFDVPKNTNVKLVIYDASGKIIKTLLDANVNVGSYEYRWDGTNANNETLASGVYFYRLITGDNSFTKKMIYLK